MFIRILDDGTIVAYNTEDTKKFFSPLGELQTTGDSQIRVLSTLTHIQFIIVRDDEGHICRICNQKKNDFAEIIDEAVLKMLMRICYDCLLIFHAGFKKTIDTWDEI